jgi:hypothetical protein
MTHIIDKVGEGVIRVRFGDHRVDLPWGSVDFSRISTDAQVRRAVAAALGVHPAELAGACVYRHTNGDATLRHPAGGG